MTRSQQDSVPAPNPVESPAAETQSKRVYESPKLTYVPPQLVKHGKITELTGFFSEFSP